MSEIDESVTDESTEIETDAESESAQDTDTTADEQDSGAKKALVAERAARRAAEKRAKELEQALADKDKSPDEQELDRVRREATAEAMSKANERLLKAEVRAAATGKLSDPADALKFLDLSTFEVGDDGELDSDAINDAIADLITSKPYLAPVTGARFEGSADQGARGKETKPAQISQAELSRMTPQQIVAAQAAGRLNDLLGIK